MPTPPHDATATANVLYSGKQNTTPKPTTPTAADTATLSKLYGSTATPTPGSSTPTTTDPAAVFYGGRVFSDHVAQRMADNLQFAPMTDTKAAIGAETKAWTDIGQKTQLNEGLLMELFDASLQVRRTHAKLDANPDDAAVAAHNNALFQQNREWMEQTTEQLTMTYGPTRGEELLRRVQKFVKQVPALSERLNEGGLGSRPDIILKLAAHVHSTGYR